MEGPGGGRGILSRGTHSQRHTSERQRGLFGNKLSGSYNG